MSDSDINTSVSPMNEFQELFEQLQREVRKLKTSNERLQKENESLREQMKNAKKLESDLFGNLSETERMSYKQQLGELIKRIDTHLEPQS